MPRENDRGEALCGIAGIDASGREHASIDGRSIPPFIGGTAWLTNETIIGQVLLPSGQYVLATAPATNPSAYEIVQPARGANLLAARGGRWQAGLASKPRSLAYGSLGEFSGAYVYEAAAGPDGTIAWKKDYDAKSGLTLSSPDGSSVDVSDAVPFDVQVIGARTAIWRDFRGDTLRSVGGVPALQPGLSPGRCRYARTSWGDVLVYWAEGRGLIAQINGARQGLVLESRVAYNHSIVSVNDTVIVMWSTTLGEGPNDLVKFRITASGAECIYGKPLAQEPITIQFEGTPPMSIGRYWFGPCIGSVDMVRLFDDPGVLKFVGVFAMVTENLLNLGTDIGPNTFDALQANHAFQKLQQAGIPMTLEGRPNIGDLDAVDKVRAVKGDIKYSSISEPLADLYLNPEPGKTLDTVVTQVVDFTNAARAKGLTVGWLEGWPSVKVEQYRPYLERLAAHGALPAFLHLDIDRRHAEKLHLSMAKAITDLAALATEYGVAFGVLLWGYDDTDEAAYAADVKKFAQDVYAIVPDLAHVCVQAWAIRTTNGKRELPNNFSANGLLDLLGQAVALFSQTDAPPPPEPERPQQLGTVKIGPIEDITHWTACDEIPKGNFVALKKKSNGKFVTVTPDGEFEERPNDGSPIETYEPGPWELFDKTEGGAYRARRDGPNGEPNARVYAFPAV